MYYEISNFNTENVEDMTAMFSNCSKIEKLNLSNFKTNKAIYLLGRFNLYFIVP